MKNLFALTLLAAFVAAGIAQADDDKKKKGALPAAEVEKQVAKLTTTIRWHDSVASAREEASRDGKLVLWIHMLGKLDGKT